MSIDDMMQLAQESYTIGFLEAVKLLEPRQDLIRGAELDDWLSVLRIDKKKLRQFIRLGLIHTTRIGAATNSPLYYSKSEIKRALVMPVIDQLIKKSK